MASSQKHYNGRPSLAGDSSPVNILSPDRTGSLSDEATCQELRGYVKRLRSAAPLDANRVPVALKEYFLLKPRAKVLCEALLKPRHHRPSSLLSSTSTADGARTPAFETSSFVTFETRTYRSSRSSVGYGTLSAYVFEQHLDVIRDWVDCVEDLHTTFRESLVNTYREWEPKASPAMADQLLCDKTFRGNAIQRMRVASSCETVSANLDFFPKFDILLGDYDKLDADLRELRSSLQAGESGISQDRTIEEITVSQRGDAVLEFANMAAEASPVFRFRVSSHMLAETSPIFAHMFNRTTSAGVLDLDVASSLPPTPSPYICSDGSKAMLFRMPQTELNVRRSFEILLHAAHMHNDLVPRNVDFDQFVAIAEASMRYQCTSPLELSVEYRWLPQWMHKATEEMPDGLLLISYVFGLRRLFTRMSKTAILNIADEKDLQSKSWPQKIKDKVWAVRTAKIDQVYACCSNILQEYLPRTKPMTTTSTPGDSNLLNGPPGLVPTSPSRCPKGSHFCDAASLGWLMMLFNELDILPHIIRSYAHNQVPARKRSLNQIVDSLRFLASPPQAHRGVCDFAPAFRAAINDIYNSVSGLTLFDISGKHGWGLSKHKSLLPQAVYKIGAPLPDLAAVKRAKEEMALKIMGHLDNIEDVYNAALINKTFFYAFKNNELAVIKNLLRKTKHGVPPRWAVAGATTKKQARDEMKALRAVKITYETTATEDDPVESNTRAKIGTVASNGRVAELQSIFDDVESDADEDGADTESESPIEVRNSGLTTPSEPSDSQAKMTREEAERILWPDRSQGVELSSEMLLQLSPQPHRDEIGPAKRIREQSEKFRANDIIFTRIEEKTLVIGDNKHLREEHDRTLGLARQKEGDGDDAIYEWI